MSRIERLGRLFAALGTMGMAVGCGVDQGPDIRPALTRDIAPLVFESTRSTAASSPTTAPATQPHVQEIAVSLPDARQAALANNLSLQTQLYTPAVAGTVVDEEKAKFDQVWRSSAGVDHRELRQLSGDGTNTTVTGTTEIVVPFRTGGTLNVGPSLTYARNTNPILVTSSYDALLGFSVSQPLLRGAGEQTNTHSIRVAEWDRRGADAETKLAAIRLLADVDRAYWAIDGLRRRIAVRRTQLQLTERQIDEARKRVAAGASPRIEITRAEAGIAPPEDALLQLQTQLMAAERELKRLMHRPDMPVNSSIAIVPTTRPMPAVLPLDQDKLTSYGILNRMEMLQAELRIAAATSEVSFARNGTLPSIVVDYGYGLHGVERDAATAFGAVFDPGAPVAFAAIKAEIPIDNGAARARLRRAILQRQLALATRELQRELIAQEITGAVCALLQGWQRIATAQRGSIHAGRNYQAEIQQFAQGVRTSTEVLNAASELASAQEREALAVMDYEIAKADLAFATGTTLGYCSVTVPSLAPPTNNATDPASSVRTALPNTGR